MEAMAGGSAAWFIWTDITGPLSLYFSFLFADALNHVTHLREISSFPNQEDLHGAAVALVYTIWFS